MPMTCLMTSQKKRIVFRIFDEDGRLIREECFGRQRHYGAITISTESCKIKIVFVYMDGEYRGVIKVYNDDGLLKGAQVYEIREKYIQCAVIATPPSRGKQSHV